MLQAQAVILQNDAIPLMVRWLDSGPEQEVATAAARALAKAAKGNRAVQQAICDAGAGPACRRHVSVTWGPAHPAWPDELISDGLSVVVLYITVCSSLLDA